MVHDVTILYPGTTTDRYGNETKDWTTATTVTSKGWVARQNQSENLQGREAEVSDWLLYLPADVMVDGGDRVQWGTYLFEVSGPPNTAWSPRGPHHIEAPLQVVTG